MSNPHSPEPARWILEMSVPDIPAWRRAFTELERKRLSELEDMLVRSFERYLRRKGYLTERQVEVLRGIARKHDVPLPLIPLSPHHTESSHTRQETSPWSALLQQARIPELEKPENARWLALLIDTEGSMGWIRLTWRGDRKNEEWRYVYHYAEPYISIGMSERESKETVDEAGRLMTTKPYTLRRRLDNDIRLERNVRVDGTKALTVARYCSPYFVKGRKMEKLLSTLFKHRVNPKVQQFEKAITELFGKYLTSDEANDIIIDATQPQFENLIKKAETLARHYLT